MTASKMPLSLLRISIAGGVILLASFAFALAASPASAQLPDCDQYPDEDICIGGVDEDFEDGDEGPGGGGGGGGGGNPDGDLDPSSRGGDGDSDGNLPFTGYPLTTLLLLLLALLITGLMIRAYLAARDRFDSGAGGRSRTR